MTTTESPTFDQALALAGRLSPADKLRLIEHLAPQVLAALPAALPLDQTAAILALAGRWAGDDLEERLAEVYATRSPVTFPVEE